MSRFLLVLCLYVFSAAVMAAGSATNCTCTDINVKPTKTVTIGSTQDCDPTSTTQVPAAPVAPVRTSASRTGLPRWHSLLPGMIR